jgi:hypothetical protein
MGYQKKFGAAISIAPSSSSHYPKKRRWMFGSASVWENLIAVMSPLAFRLTRRG